MIIREWRGRASALRAGDYPRHFRDVVLPDLRAIPGFLGVRLSRRHVQGQIEYVVHTSWESMDAVRGFTGPDVDRAVVEPGAVSALDEHDTHVRHYEVVEEAE